MNIVIGLVMISSPAILLIVIMLVLRGSSIKEDNYLRAYTMPNGRIICPRDGMNQEIGVCKHCVHFHKYMDDGLPCVVCKYHERLGGDF